MASIGGCKANLRRVLYRLLMDKATMKKYGLDKVALFGLVVMGLLAAQVIVAHRAKVSLVAAPQLPQSGLSALIPTGRAWNTGLAWQFRDNSFVLSSSFGPAPGRITTAVQLRYLPAPLTRDADVYLRDKQAEILGEILKRGEIALGQFTISWAHISAQSGLLNGFFGVATLPDGRVLTIEVHQLTGEAELAEQLFDKIARSVEFEDNQLLAAGARMVEMLKQQGFYELTRHKPEKEFFLIHDVRNKIIGFLASMVKVLVDEAAPPQLRSLDFYRIKTKRAVVGGHSLFQSDEKVEVFRWVSNMGGYRPGRQVVEMQLGPDGILTVRTLPDQAGRQYAPGPAAVPEVLLDHIVSGLLETGADKVMVDLIMSTGRIIPTLVSRIEPGKTAGADAAYAVRVDFLDGPGYYQLMYLDDDKQVFKAETHQAEVYLIERSSREEVLTHFPAWRDYILQANSILEGSEVSAD